MTFNKVSLFVDWTRIVPVARLNPNFKWSLHKKRKNNWCFAYNGTMLHGNIETIKIEKASNKLWMCAAFRWLAETLVATSSSAFALSLCECEKSITLVWVEKIICFVTSAPQTVLYNRYKWLAIHELYKTLWREKKTSFSHRIKNFSHVICSSFPIIHVKRRKNRRKSFSNFLPSNHMTN